MAAPVSLPSIQEMFPDHLMDLGLQTMKLKSHHQRYPKQKSTETKKIVYSFDILRSDPSSSSLEHIASSAESLPRVAAQASWRNVDISDAFSVVVTPAHCRSNSSSSSSSSVAVPRASPSRASSSSNSSLDRDVLSMPSTSASDQFFTEEDDSEEKRHVCKLCNKRFNRPSSLGIHMNTHTGATPFRCPHPGCGREFNVNSNMRRHYRNHNNNNSTDNNTNNNNANDADNNNDPSHVNAIVTASTSTTSPTPSTSNISLIPSGSRLSAPPTRFRYPSSPPSPRRPTQQLPTFRSPSSSSSSRSELESSISPLLGSTALAASSIASGSAGSVGSSITIPTTSAVTRTSDSEETEEEENHSSLPSSVQHIRTKRRRLEGPQTSWNVNKRHSSSNTNTNADQPRSSVSWELDSKEGFLILRRDVPLHPVLGSSLHYSSRSSGLSTSSRGSGTDAIGISSEPVEASKARGGGGGGLGVASSQTRSLVRKRSNDGSIGIERKKRKRKFELVTPEKDGHSTSSTMPLLITNTPCFSTAEALLTPSPSPNPNIESEVGYSKSKF